MQSIYKITLCLFGMSFPFISFAKTVDVSKMMGDIVILPSKDNNITYESQNVVHLKEENGVIYLSSPRTSLKIEESFKDQNNEQIVQVNGSIVNIAVGEGAVSEMNLPNKKIKSVGGKGNGQHTPLKLYIPAMSDLVASKQSGSLTVTMPLKTIKLSKASGEIKLLDAKQIELETVNAANVEISNPTGVVKLLTHDASEVSIPNGHIQKLMVHSTDASSVKVKSAVLQLEAFAEQASSIDLPNVSESNIIKIREKDAASINMDERR